jgi:hypothetical protein
MVRKSSGNEAELAFLRVLEPVADVVVREGDSE